MGLQAAEILMLKSHNTDKLSKRQCFDGFHYQNNLSHIRSVVSSKEVESLWNNLACKYIRLSSHAFVSKATDLHFAGFPSRCNQSRFLRIGRYQQVLSSAQSFLN